MQYSIKKIIPNILTSLNFLSGCIAAYLAFNHFYLSTLLFCFLGVFFDFFDGYFARILKVEDQFGKHFDSLSDIITSGFVPGIIMYQLFLLSGVKEINYVISIFETNFIFSIAPIGLIGFLISLGAAYRLANFNVIKTSNSFIGLPAPANSLLIVSLPVFLDYPLINQIKPFILSPYSLSIISLISIFLMNVKWKMFKINFNRNTYLFPLIFVFLSIILIFFLKEAAITLSIISYLLLSLVKNIFEKN